MNTLNGKARNHQTSLFVVRHKHLLFFRHRVQRLSSRALALLLFLEETLAIQQDVNSSIEFRRHDGIARDTTNNADSDKKI